MIKNLTSEFPRPGLTICIPAYNEERGVADTVASVLSAAEQLKGNHEIIIVNDGSSDGTGAVADELAERFEWVIAIHQETNKGVGAALKLVLERASFDRITLIPGDYAYSQQGIEGLMRNAHRADLLISFRDNETRPPVRRVLSWVFSSWLRIITGCPLRDGHSLFVFPVEPVRALVQILPDDHRYHVVALVHLLCSTRSFVQVPVYLQPKADSSSGVMRLSFITKISLTMMKLFLESKVLGVPFRRHRPVEISRSEELPVR